MSAVTSPVRLERMKNTSRSVDWLHWLPLVIIFMVGLLIRLFYLPVPAYHGDLEHFAIWIQTITQQGILHFYDPILRFAIWDRTYPPLSTLVFGVIRLVYGSAPSPAFALSDPLYIDLLKVLPVTCEMVLIVASYWWLNRRPVLRWLLPGLLAVYPGLIATTAWWGQYDAAYALFVVLALFALNRDRPLLAWILFACGLLFKQPAIIASPLMLVITFRRYGWRQTLNGIAVCGLICLAAFGPFMFSRGPIPPLSPYLNASDVFPYLSNNAWNFWYALGSLKNGAPVHFEDPHFHDAVMLFDFLTYKGAGLLLFGTYILLIMMRMWRQAHERREFVWAAALFFGFFMFPTQVHERYLYPVAILSLLALSQDLRLIGVAVGVAFTYSYNILGVAIPYRDPNNHFGTDTLAIPTALLNIVLFLETLNIAWTPKQATTAAGTDSESIERDQPEKGSHVNPQPIQTV